MAKVTTKDIKSKQKSKNKHSKIKKHVTEVFMLSLIIFVIIFIAYQIISLIINPTDSFLVEQGEVLKEESLIGYVIRDESVIETSNNQNKLVQIKNEGERAAVGEEIFRYQVSNEEEISNKIKELNERYSKGNGRTNRNFFKRYKGIR